MSKIKSKFSFVDGSKIYDKYEKKYNTHEKGYVILAPPASGKTTYVKNQKNKDWIDSDDIFSELGVKWKLNSDNPEEFKLNYLRADYMLEQTKALGFRILSSLFYKYIPDAIVIPKLTIHKKYISMRKDLSLQTCLNIRKYLKNMAKEKDVLVFEEIEDAIEYLENKKN